MVNLSQINIRKLRQIRSARFSGSQLASLSFEQHSASPTIISSLILPISATYKYFFIYGELRLFYGTYKYRTYRSTKNNSSPVPTSTGTFRSTKNNSTTRFTVEQRYGLPTTPRSFENSLHTGILNCSPLEDFIALTLLNSWFSSYSLARRVYYLIHASFLRRVYYFQNSNCTDLFMPNHFVFWYIN